MNILVTGAAGFVGSTLCHELRIKRPSWTIYGLDNLSRIGSETNVSGLLDAGVKFCRGDVRRETDFEQFSDIDFVIDAAANPSVLAGSSGVGIRQLIDQNLVGTINTLEFCRKQKAGFVLLSSSRVYSIDALRAIPLLESGSRFVYGDTSKAPGISIAGVAESFSTTPPISLYGVTKLSSELLALEYASIFAMRVFVNRCGVMSGEGQFGIPSQGIVAYWLAKALAGHTLVYTGQGGNGFQVRDLLHPLDLASLLVKQLESDVAVGKVYNVSGGMSSSFSLSELTQWCKSTGIPVNVLSDSANRPNDVPHVVLDSSLVESAFNWKPKINRIEIFSRVMSFISAQDNWLKVSGNA